MSMFNNNYLKGKFVPRHPEKCLNYNGKIATAKEITFRSSWEKIFSNYMDLNENVIEWGSEIIEIPYYSAIDNKNHRYITDFVFTCKNRDGKIEKWLIEIKPQNQVPMLKENGQIQFPELKRTKKGKVTNKQMESWQEHCNVLKRNHEKWTQARLWCKRNGYKFKVITQEELALTSKSHK